MVHKVSFVVQSVLVVFLLVTSLLGDFLVGKSEVHLHKALLDNATHAVIAGISWLIVCFRFKYENALQIALEVLGCAALGSLIDLDHFLAARSLRLKAATSIKGRPILHCSTIPIIFCTVTLLLSYLLQLRWLQKMGLLVFTAFFSHHTRDATRRGFWIYPFGSTPPISKLTYVLTTCIIPYITCALRSYIKMYSLYDMDKEIIV